MNKVPEILSGSEVQALPEEDTKFYLNPYIPEGSITFLFGKYGTFKTPLTLQMAKAIVAGKNLWGMEVTKATPVLYVEVDSPKPVIVPRMKHIHLPEEIDIAFMGPTANIPNPGKTVWDAQAVDMLKRAHAAKDYKVVFFDALRGVHDLDDKLSEVPHQVYSAAAALFPGASLVFIHHERKTKPDETDDIRDEGFSGSQAWVNHATVAIRVVKSGNQITLRHTKSQASDIQPPIHLIVKDDGANFDTKAAGTVHDVKPLLDEARKNKLSKRETDKFVAGQLGISLRTATRRRLEIEDLEKKGFGI